MSELDRYGETDIHKMTSDTIIQDTSDISSKLTERPQQPNWYRLALPFSERRLLLATGDAFLLTLAIMSAILFRTFMIQTVTSQLQLWNGPNTWLFVLTVIWLVTAAINECYDIKIAAQSSEIIQRSVLTALMTGLLYLLLFFVFERPPSRLPADLLDLTLYPPPRMVSMLFIGIATCLISIWRLVYIRVFTKTPLRRRVIVVGAGSSGKAVVRAIQQQVQDYEIVGFVDDDPGMQNCTVAGIPVLGNRYRLLEQAQHFQVDELVLAITDEIHSDLFRALMTCYEYGISIKPMPLLYEETLGQIPVEHLGRKWFPAPLWNTGHTPTVFRAVKRLIDLSIALVGLVFLAFVFPLIAIAIYVDSPGPLFYIQKRLGKSGVPFRLIKFRSMIPDAEKGGKAVWAQENDSRITRVGTFLRRTRLDEFPQLWNVLKGEMSIVGPRPERPQFVEQLQEEIPFYRARLSVKPGLTGWAQIKYRYGGTVDDARIKLQYDLYYIKNRSIILDLLIMLRTIKVMLTFRGR